VNRTTPQRCPALKDGFAWYEKLLLRTALAGLVTIGAVGIYLESSAAAIGYLLLVLIGGLLVIYDFLCVSCPYPYEYPDCLFFPPELLTSVLKRRRGKIHWVRKALLLVTAAGLVLIPQYWLWDRWGLVAAFWILAAPIGLVFPLYYCGRCRHKGCPLNRGVGSISPQAADNSE